MIQTALAGLKVSAQYPGKAYEEEKNIASSHSISFSVVKSDLMPLCICLSVIAVVINKAIDLSSQNSLLGV